MSSPRLAALARHSDDDRLVVRIFRDQKGALMLATPEQQEADPTLSELDGFECMRLAAAATDGPPLVVELLDGGYCVLLNDEPDPRKHLPLQIDDADVLLGPAAALGGFGRRTDDVIPLAPWAPDYLQVDFEPDDPAFLDVPIVAYGDEVAVTRGDLDEQVLGLVTTHLNDVGEAGQYGVFHNEFGEFSVYAVGERVEPHNDVRLATVIDLPSLIEGSESLNECALRLRQLADRMEIAEKNGWTLSLPVNDGYAYPERISR